MLPKFRGISLFTAVLDQTRQKKGRRTKPRLSFHILLWHNRSEFAVLVAPTTPVERFEAIAS